MSTNNYTLYSLSTDFNNSINLVNLSNDILESELSLIYINLGLSNSEMIWISTTTELTINQKIILDDIVANHNSTLIPTPIDWTGKKFMQSHMPQNSIKIPAYTSVGEFKFPGSQITTLTHIHAISYCSLSATSYTIRIKDSQNNTIVETQCTNKSSEICNLPILYTPTIDTIFDIQVKVEGAGNSNTATATVNVISMNYD